MLFFSDSHLKPGVDLQNNSCSNLLIAKKMLVRNRQMLLLWHHCHWLLSFSVANFLVSSSCSTELVEEFDGRRWKRAGRWIQLTSKHSHPTSSQADRRHHLKWIRIQLQLKISRQRNQKISDSDVARHPPCNTFSVDQGRITKWRRTNATQKRESKYVFRCI